MSTMSEAEGVLTIDRWISDRSIGEIKHSVYCEVETSLVVNIALRRYCSKLLLEDEHHSDKDMNKMAYFRQQESNRSWIKS